MKHCCLGHVDELILGVLFACFRLEWPTEEGDEGRGSFNFVGLSVRLSTHCNRLCNFWSIQVFGVNVWFKIFLDQPYGDDVNVLWFCDLDFDSVTTAEPAVGIVVYSQIIFFSYINTSTPDSECYIYFNKSVIHGTHLFLFYWSFGRCYFIPPFS